MRDPEKLIRPDLERIPGGLEAKPRWILWKLEKKEDKKKLDKVPCHPDGYHIDAHDPKNWMSFEDVSRIYEKSNDAFSGVGFVPAGQDKIIGIDFDHCINGDGQPNPEILKDIQAINSYTEISPSGEGVRIFAFGDVPKNGNNNGAGVEIYKDGRFLTVTGHPLPGMPTDLENSAGAILGLYNRYFGDKSSDHKESATKHTFFDDVAGGNSHKALVRYAARLISKGITREEALEILTDVIKARVRTDKQEKRLSDLHRTVESALKYAPHVSPIKPRFTFKKIEDLEITPPDWIVQDLVEADSLVQIFGDPGCGKTFVGIDLAGCISAGIDFHGHDTKKGTVCYIAGEGQNGLARRFAAWGIRNDIDLKAVPLFISTAPAALCDDDYAQQVFNAVDEIAEQYGPPRLIVIDTLARNFGPGDENSTKDMGAFIQAVDALRCAHDATILLIHHTGHGNKERARGAMAMTGALDAQYRMDKDGFDVVRFEAVKMKDASFPEPLAFKIRAVELGILDKDGFPVTSAILDDADYEARTDDTQNHGKWQAVGIEALNDLHRLERERLENNGQDADAARVTLEDWKKECRYRDMGRMAFSRIKDSLTSRGDIRLSGGFVTCHVRSV